MKSIMLPAISVLTLLAISPLYAVGQRIIRPDTSFNYSTTDSLTKSIYYSRKVLKYHFLCTCLEDNQVTAKAFAHDYSRSSYYEHLIISYSLEGIDKLLTYEKKFIKEARFSGEKSKSEHFSAGDIFFRCMRHYEGKELDTFSRSIDQYFLFSRK